MDQLNFVMVFVEGILSFLSPCVLPILPVYLAILAKNKAVDGEINVGENGEVNRGSQFILLRNTFLFVLGIATTFFILGLGIGAFRTFINEYKRYFLMGGGLFVLVMGFFYIGDLNIPFLQRERKFHMQVKEMNPLVAYLLGFTFSFGWTPCIGPLLASVLVLASTSKSHVTGFILIGVYTLGFIIPFMLLAIFSEKMLKLLNGIKLKMSLLQKVGGYLLLIMGFVLLVNGIRTPKFVVPKGENTTIGTSSTDNTSQKEEAVDGKSDETNTEQEDKDHPVAPDFTLTDQYGNTHTLSDYKGKTVFLNFWATWCPPCKAEMPDIQDLYETRGLNKEDVIVLGVAFPNMGDEKSKEGIIEFLEENEYTFPVVMDEEGALAYYYGISAFPTTFIINRDGNVEGYLQGMMQRDMMDQVIDNTKNK
nr:cytochrome c biogenesis protein/redoxin [uncultured Niameybacter sp.]